MIRLVYNELYKIFHKKSIYIIWLLIFMFCLLNNILFKINYNNDGIYIDNKLDNLSDKINKLETKISTEDGNTYVTDKTELDLLRIQNNYKKDTFQYNMAKSYFYDIIYNINYYSNIEESNEMVAYYKNIYNKYLEWYNSNDNISFIKEELSDINEKLQKDQNNYELSLQKEILDLRIKNNIDYSNNYLNRALITYYDSSLALNNYSDKLEYQDKITYNELLSEKNINKYIIDNKINLNKDNDLRGCLKTILEDYEIFIIIIIVIISAGIISEEYNKGTIKLLLARPYSRTRILLSKYISCLVILLISIIFLILMELWIGGVIFGFDSLKIPIVVYDLNINNIKEYNIFTYILIRTTYNFPKLLLILTISFGLSTLTLNSVLSSISTFSIYIFNDTIINLLKKYKIIKYTVFPNYNFITYINGNINKYLNITINHSIIIYIFHFLLIFSSLFVIFKRRDIGNI